MKEAADTRLHDRVLRPIDLICSRNDLLEGEKLEAIGFVVEGTLADLQEPLQKQKVPIRPSILPEPDDITINRMADHQKKLRTLGVPKAVQEEKIDALLWHELMLQKNRTPGMSS